ncbi:hypothetical protein NDU88_012375 [Pleurodeles waltl]|uniref:Uncharacterized protein n=1 Tax=Pleurodeles waltl TaxID=8319 RepID=A0AAV7R1A1_PLEWA|nr:hypothetical protein NDU88_012375 [Pleurodeles waltl]
MPDIPVLWSGHGSCVGAQAGCTSRAHSHVSAQVPQSTRRAGGEHSYLRRRCTCRSRRTPAYRLSRAPAASLSVSLELCCRSEARFRARRRRSSVRGDGESSAERRDAPRPAPPGC